MIDEHKAGIAAMERTKFQNLKQLICIEGNIGSGKTTLATELGALMGARVMFEPVETNPFLERYYRDPKRYALEMQFWLMSRRFEMHEQAIRHIWETGQTVIMDRSIYGDWVFARCNYIMGNIDSVGWDSYCHHREVMSRYLLVPHTMLFLETPPSVCLDRIISRGRGCEKTIPLSYLNELSDLHRDLVSEMVMRGTEVIQFPYGQRGDAREIARKVVALSTPRTMPEDTF